MQLAGVAIAADGWLRDHGDGGAVLEVPVANSVMDGRAMLATGRDMVGSTLHWLPLLNGYSGHPPASESPADDARAAAAGRAALAALCALAEPRWIVVHFGMLHDDEAAAWRRAEGDLGLVRAATFGHDTVYDAGPACARASASSTVASTAGDRQTFGGVALAPLPPGDPAGRLDADVPRQVEVGSFAWLWVQVANEGPTTLPGMVGSVPGAVQLQARWRDVASGALVASGEITPLAVDLVPGATTRAQVALSAPRNPGNYLLEIGLLQQGQGWLGDAAGDGRYVSRSQVEVVP